MAKFTRRGFMVGCSAAIAAMAGSRLSYVAFGSPEQEPNQEILLVIFLRGGMDGLSLIPVLGGADRGIYQASRPNIAIPTTGQGAALNLNDQFGLNAGAAPLLELYQANKLAIVHAAGLTSDTRSHFDAMQYMELGTPDNKSSHSGWLTRYLETAGDIPTDVILPALSVGSLNPTSLAGSRVAVGMTSPSDFSFNGHWQYGDWQRLALRSMYGGSSWLHEAGLQTLDAIDVLEYGDPGSYTPENGAQYPNNSFGNSMKAVAQMIKLQLGLRVATVDLGGWDTHDGQGNDGGGYFADRVGTLAQGLHGLYTDLNGNATNNGARVTTVVMSEFGRSLKENGSRGTDHGHGNVMLVLGDNVNGGKVHGPWPGLSNLYDSRDLAITTDYRQVLSEILIRRFGNPNLGTIFPNYANYQPLGVVTGADLQPNYTEATPTATATLDPNMTPTPTRELGGTIPNATPTPAPTDTGGATPTPAPTRGNTPGTGAMDNHIYIPVAAR